MSSLGDVILEHRWHVFLTQELDILLVATGIFLPLGNILGCS